MREELIFYRVWLPNILSEAELIVEEATLRRAWLSGVKGETSVIGPDELLVQTLDSGFGEDWSHVPRYLPEHSRLATALMKFRAALLALEAWKRDEASMDEELLASDSWADLKQSARNLIKEASAAGFSSADFAPE